MSHLRKHPGLDLMERLGLVSFCQTEEIKVEEEYPKPSPNDWLFEQEIAAWQRSHPKSEWYSKNYVANGGDK